MKKLFLLLIFSVFTLQMQAQVVEYRKIGLILTTYQSEIDSTDNAKDALSISLQIGEDVLQSLKIRKVKHFKHKDYKSFLDTELLPASISPIDKAYWKTGKVVGIGGLKKTTLGGMSVKYKDYKDDSDQDDIRLLRVFVIENGKDKYIGIINAAMNGNYFSGAVKTFESIRPQASK